MILSLYPEVKTGKTTVILAVVASVSLLASGIGLVAQNRGGDEDRIRYELAATHLIGIVPPDFAHWLRWPGLAAVPVGRRFGPAGERSQAALIKVARIRR